MTLESRLNSSPCPLCAAADSTFYHRDRQRSYYQCATCRLVYVPAHEHLTATAEKAYYDLHQNDPADPGYRRFLSRMAQPLLERLAPGARGLDFGCGPGPALAEMLAEAGMQVHLYDIHYAPDADALLRQYDFITCTEVLEHLHRPGAELARLLSCLKSGGWLGIMTKRVRNRTAFANWHYIRDPTHIAFFSEDTLIWIARRWELDLVLSADDVALFRKRRAAARHNTDTINHDKGVDPS